MNYKKEEGRWERLDGIKGGDPDFIDGVYQLLDNYGNILKNLADR